MCRCRWGQLNHARVDLQRTHDELQQSRIDTGSMQAANAAHTLLLEEVIHQAQRD